MSQKKKTPKSPAVRAPKPRVPAPELISLDEVEAVHNEAVEVVVLLGKNPRRVVGRRLTPEESARVQAWLERARPNLIQPKQPGEVLRLDLDDPEYPARKLKCEHAARALAVWCAYPVFRQSAEERKVAVTNDEEIIRFIESGRWPNDFLQALFVPLQRDEVRPLLGFTYGSGYPLS